jgi:hypothetical protein
MNKYISMILFVSASLFQPMSGQDGFIDKTGKVVIEARFAQVLSFSEGLAPVRMGTKCGYIDREGKERIPLQFEDAKRFMEGRAAVRVGEKWGFIDKDGKWVVEPTYVQASSFSDGLAAVAIPITFTKESAPGKAFIRIKPLQEFSMRAAANVQVGIAVETIRDLRTTAKGGWGYIDTSGKVVIPNQFFQALDFSDGRAMVRRRGGQLVDLSEEESEKARSAKLSLLHESFSNEDGLIVEAAGYIDKTGAMVIPPRFSTALPFREGLAYVDEFTHFKDTLRGYIDTSGKTVIQLYRYAAHPMGGRLLIDWDSLLPMEEFVRADGEPLKKWGVAPTRAVGSMGHKDGLALVDSGSGFIHVPKWTYIDTSGKVVSEKVGEFSSSFSEGFAAVRKGGPFGGKTGYIDRTGKFVIPYQYKAGGGFSEGLAPVQIDKTWGYIDRTGKVVIEPRFVQADWFREGLAKVTLPK